MHEPKARALRPARALRHLDRYYIILVRTLKHLIPAKCAINITYSRLPREKIHLKVTALGVLCCFALFVCLTLLASFFLPSHLSFKNMYILGLVFGVIGGFITPAFSFILS